MFFLPLFSFIVIASCESESLILSKFFKEPVICDVQERISLGCSTKFTTTRSVIRCLALCGYDKHCIGASLDENSHCFLHQECSFISGCTINNMNHRYWTKYCSHGSWDMLTKSCKCVDGFYGGRCKQCYRKCEDLRGLYNENGDRLVYLDPEQNGQPILVTCYINPTTGYAVPVILYNKGFYDFNKTWIEYVKGFRYDDTHFWTGLYAWNKLTNYADCTKMYFVYRLTSRDNLYRVHYDVQTSFDGTTFSLTFGSSSSHSAGSIPGGSYFGNCLNSLQNVPFSTWDADQDGDSSQNCAARAGSGWFYTPGCNNPCNALGFSPHFAPTKPAYQLLSLLGLDISAVGPGKFELYIKCS